MKNKRTLLFVLILVLALSISLFACNTPEKNDDDTETITWGEWKVELAPTLDSVGRITRTASNGEVDIFYLPALTDSHYKAEKISDPTCIEEGEMRYTINVRDKDYVFVLKTAKVGHLWSEEITYVWDEDGSACTASRVCQYDANHVDKAKATITSEQTKAPTFDANGETTYTATFDVDWAPVDTKVVADIAKYVLSKVDRVEPTVNEVGNIEYYKGTDGKYYNDAKRTREITLESTVLPRLVPTSVAEVKATYGKDGVMAHYTYGETKYTKDEQGMYHEVTDADLVIPELLGTVTIYVNGTLQEKTISHKKSEDLKPADILAIVDAVSGKDYANLIACDSDLDTRKEIKDPIAYARDTQDVSIYIYKCYTVTFDAKGGRSDITSVDIEYGDTYDALPVPTYDGWTFNGWYNKTGTLVTADMVIEPKAHTLTAKWYDAGLEFAYIGGDETLDVVLTKYNGTASSLVIPEHIVALGNKPVTEIGEGAFVKESGGGPSVSSYKAAPTTGVTSLTLPSTLTKIGASAFAGLQLESLDLPSGLKSIGDGAFAYMTELRSLVIPSSIEFIGYDIAPACYALEYITIENGGNDLYVSSMNGVSFGGIMYVGKDTIPEREHSLIGTIPAVQQYDYIAGATKSTIPSGTKRIYSGAFDEVDSVGVEIPASVVEIMGTAFTDSNLSDVSFAEGTEPLVIRTQAFYDTQLTQIVLPTRISVIEADAFSENLGLKIYLANESMPSYAAGWNNYSPTMQYLVYLYSETNTVEGYDSSVTGYWHYVNSVPEVWDMVYDVEMILGARLMYGLTGVHGNATEAVVPDTFNEAPIVEVGTGAFDTAPNVKKVTFGTNIERIETGTLSALALTDIKISNMDMTLEDAALSGSAATIVNYYGPTNVYYYMYNNGMKKDAESTLKTLEVFGTSGEKGSPIHTNYISTLETFKCTNCANLLQLSNASLETICIDSVVVIDEYTFGTCPKLKELYVPFAKDYLAIRDPAFTQFLEEAHVVVHYGYNNEVTDDGLYGYRLENGILYLLEYLGSSTEVVVPEYIGDKKIDEYYAFAGDKKITKMSFAEGMIDIPQNLANTMSSLTTIDITNIQNIGNNAFLGCSALVNVNFTGGVNIGAYAFKGTGLQQLVLDESIGTIGKSAFANCTALTSVILPESMESIGAQAFYNIGTPKAKATIVMPSSITTMPDADIFGSSNIAALCFRADVPDEMLAAAVSQVAPKYTYSESKPVVLESGRDGYWHYDESGAMAIWPLKEYLIVEPTAKGANDYIVVGYIGTNTEITIPANIGDKPITSIKANTFENNSSIVTLNVNCATVGVAAFKGCTALTTLRVGEKTVNINENAFENCSALTTVDMSNAANIAQIKEYAFAHTGITTLSMPIITKHDVPILSYAFESINITEITLNGHYYVAASTFDNCMVLETITLTGECRATSMSFNGCENVHTITTNGGSLVAAGSAVENTYVTDGVLYFQSKQYYGTIHLGKNVQIDQYSWAQLSCRPTIIVDPENPYIAMVDGCIVDKPTQEIVYYGNNEGTIPNNVTAIETNAFAYSSLTSITLPDTLNRIESRAFAYATSLESIHIPISVKFVGDQTFINCTALTTIEVENTESAVSVSWDAGWNKDCNANIVYGTGITTDPTYNYVLEGDNATLVKYKGSDTVITLPNTIEGHNVIGIGDIFSDNKNITKVTMGDNMTTIGDRAFYYCSNLQTVDLKNVKNIGKEAFYYNTKLTSINLKTVEHIGRSAFAFNTFSEIVLPASLISMDQDAFRGNTQMTSIIFHTTKLELLESNIFAEVPVKTFNIPEGVKKINGKIFGNKPKLESVTIPSTMEEFSPSAFNGPKLDSIKVAAGNPYYTSKDASGAEFNGVVYIGIERKNWINSGSYMPCYYERNYFVLGGVSSTIPKQVIGNSGAAEDVVGIASYAFELRDIKKVTIHDKIKRIENNAFASTNSIESVKIEGNTLEYIGSSAFNTEGSWTSVILPQSVKMVEDYAFTKGGLTVYCRGSQASAQNWNQSWHGEYVNVVWNYAG